MADDDQYNNDEYQFSEFDATSPEAVDENQSFEQREKLQSERSPTAMANIKRNAFIVVAVVLFAMILYKFLAPLFSGTEETIKPTASKMATSPRTSAQPVVSEPMQPSIPTVSKSVSDVANVEKKISAMELIQQNVRQDVDSVSSQMGSMTTNVNEMSQQIAQLKQIIASLTTKIDDQSHDIERLIVLSRPKPVRVKRTIARPVIKYYIQAVIPGRAWLISSNGSTLSVRDGSPIPGFGVVKLIDPKQGRVLTSTGQLIRFSQDDS